MQTELVEGGGVRVALDAREAKLLATALERALFIDTPPHLQGATMDFAERLLRALKPGDLAADR